MRELVWPHAGDILALEFHRVRETLSEKKRSLHAFLLLRTFARVPAGAFFFDLL
jgi:hypothetical protein